MGSGDCVSHYTDVSGQGLLVTWLMDRVTGTGTAAAQAGAPFSAA